MSGMELYTTVQTKNTLTVQAFLCMLFFAFKTIKAGKR
jgi:hypothetical protein